MKVIGRIDWYTKILEWWVDGRYTEEDVLVFVEAQFITQEQADTILATPQK